MLKYELSDELKTKLSYHREQMACKHAKFLLEGIPHEVEEPFHWKGEDGKPGLTVLEIDVGQRLAAELKPIYLKEQEAIVEAKAAQAAKEKEDEKAEVPELMKGPFKGVPGPK